MRKFAETYPDFEIVQAPLAQISWYHHIALMDKLKDNPRPLVQQMNDLHQIQLNWASEEIKVIMKHSIKDISRIEQVALSMV